MNILNEALMKTVSQDLADDKLTPVVDPTYADAVKTGKQIETDLAKRFKDQEKAKDEFVKDNHKTERKVKGTKEMKKMKLSESLFEDTVEKPERNLFYKSTREPLADIIQQELTGGEVVYNLNKDGKYIMTWAPSLNLDEYDIGVGHDEKRDYDYIMAYLPTEEMCADVEAIATKYNRKFESGFDKYAASDKKYFTKIYVYDDDWDEPYFDPKVQIRPDGRKKKVA